MIASLGMYDPPPLQAANDRLWQLIRAGLRRRGLNAPEALTRGEDAYWPAWQSPALVLSQTCGLPFRARLHQRVTLIGTPDYGVEGCAPGYYRSVLVVRRDDPRQSLADFAPARLAYNEALSQSGWAAPLACFAERGLTPTPALQTGSHAASAQAVAEGAADIAAIDAVTWAILCDHNPVARALRIVGKTAPTPGLPLIAAPGADAAASFDAVAEAIAALADHDRRLLRLQGLARIPARAYLALPIPASPEQIAQPV